VTVFPNTRIDCLFNLTGKTKGNWSVWVMNPDGKTGSLNNGFTVVQQVIPIVGLNQTPVDLNLDGKYEDLNANGQVDYADVNNFFNSFEWIVVNEPVEAFDFNGNGRLDADDIIALFDQIS
jgi:PKD repeat protein